LRDTKSNCNIDLHVLALTVLLTLREASN